MQLSWNAMDCSPRVSSVLGISQARILEWVAISSSGYLLNPGIELIFLHWQVGCLPLKPPGKTRSICVCVCIYVYVCVYIYTHMHTHIHTNTYSYIHTYIHHWDRGKELWWLAWTIHIDYTDVENEPECLLQTLINKLKVTKCENPIICLKASAK